MRNLIVLNTTNNCHRQLKFQMSEWVRQINLAHGRKSFWRLPNRWRKLYSHGFRVQGLPPGFIKPKNWSTSLLSFPIKTNIPSLLFTCLKFNIERALWQISGPYPQQDSRTVLNSLHSLIYTTMQWLIQKFWSGVSEWSELQSCQLGHNEGEGVCPCTQKLGLIFLEEYLCNNGPSLVQLKPNLWSEYTMHCKDILTSKIE